MPGARCSAISTTFATQPCESLLSTGPNRVYDISQVPKFESFMSERYGKPIVLPREQSGGPKFTASDLSKSSLKKLLNFYRKDYEMLSQFYTPPKR